jgi:hypothetical protein
MLQEAINRGGLTGMGFEEIKDTSSAGRLLKSI